MDFKLFYFYFKFFYFLIKHAEYLRLCVYFQSFLGVTQYINF